MKRHLILLLGLLVLSGTSCRQVASTGASGSFAGPINGVFENNPSIVLIVPTHEENVGDQQRVSAYVRGIETMVRERGICSDTEVVTDAEALNRDLGSNSVLVYGTVRGNLWLAKYVKAIPIAIEPNRIISDQGYEGINLRFITAWPNPQNPNKGMLVYTAQQARDVVGINAVTHGVTDYVIAQGKTILGTGSYVKSKGQWAIRPPLDLDDAFEDTDFFFKTVEQVHPNHLANISGAGYKALKQRCREALRLEQQQNGGISKSFLTLTVAEAAASFGDGHTYCSPGPDLINMSDRSVLMPPFKLKWQAGHIVIADTTSDLESIEGTRLLKINGIAIKEFLQPVLTKISGEREANRISRFLSRQQIYWVLLQPVPRDRMEIVISRGIEEPNTMTVGLIDLPGHTQTFGQESGYPAQSSYRFCQGDSTCYWRYNSFIYSESGRKHIDTVFSEIRERKAENLIIDLRFNGGGNSRAGDYMLNYITSKPYRMYSGSDVKISKQVYEKGWLGVLARLLRGRIIKWRSKAKKPQDMGYRFGGRVYALIGPVTFSSASDFAAVLKDFDIATLVGEETGGVRECFGDAPRFPLPNSGIQFGVSHKRWYAPIPKPGDDKHGTIPDIAVNDQLLARYTDADDPVLAFTLAMIAEQGGM